jgi:hypothetical protein
LNISNKKGLLKMTPNLKGVILQTSPFYSCYLKALRAVSDANPFRTRENMGLENWDRIQILLTHWSNLRTYPSNSGAIFWYT